MLSTVADKQGTMFDLCDDPAIWSAVNGDDADFTADERAAVQRRLARYLPSKPAARTALARSLDNGPDVEELRATLHAEYQRYRTEARGIVERFELMRKFLPDSNTAEAGVADKLTKQIIDEYQKCKPRLVELRDLAVQCRTRIARLP